MAKKRTDPDPTGDRPGNGNMYALLIGINKYQSLTNLRGCLRDIDRVEGFLKLFWQIAPEQAAVSHDTPFPHHVYSIEEMKDYDFLKICRLENEQATYGNILAAFHEFLQLARGNDSVWIHFSGHGSEAPSAHLFADLENLKDQGLMCADYAITEDGQYSGFLADKEVSILLDELLGGEKGDPHILVTLDSCHSGSGTRDPQIRYRNIVVPDHAKKRSLDSYYLGKFKDTLSGPEDALHLPAPQHVVMTACTNEQLAGERQGGFFTNALIDSLMSVPGPGEISYADLLIRVRAEIRDKNPLQTPQFEVLGGLSAYSAFLQGYPFGDPDRYEIRFQNGVFAVGVGAIHGIPTTADMHRVATSASRPLQLDIYSLKTKTVTPGERGARGGSRGGQAASTGANKSSAGSEVFSLGEGEQYSSMEFRRDDLGFKLHIIDLAKGNNDQVLNGAFIRQISDEYSLIEFRQGGFGIKMEVFDANKGLPIIDRSGSETPVTVRNPELPPAILPTLTPLIQNQWVASATIKEVGPVFSTIELNSDVELTEATYFGVLNYLPADPEFVLVSGSEEEVQEFIQAGEEFTRIGAKNIRLIANPDQSLPHQLVVHIGEDSFTIEDLLTQTLVDMEYSKTQRTEVLVDLIQIVNWRRMLSLENPKPDSQLRDKISLHLDIGNGETLAAEALEGESVEFIAKADERLISELDRPGDRYYRITPRVTLKEDVEQELFYYLFSCYSSYGINVEDERKRKESGSIEYAQFNDWGLDAGQNSDEMTFKLVVATEEIDSHQFLQEGIFQDRGRPRPRVQVNNGFKDWTVVTMKLKMIREEAAGTSGTNDNGGGSGGDPEPDPDSDDPEPRTVERAQRLGFRRSHAFVIGINQYPQLAANLQTAVSDAEEIAKRLKLLQNFDNVLLLNDVSKSQLEVLLDWLQQPSPEEAPLLPNSFFPAASSFYPSRIGWLKEEEELGPDQDKDRLEILELITDKGTSKEKVQEVYLVEATADALDQPDGPIIAPEDSLVFYYAGHGFPGEVGAGPAGFLAPTDAANELLDNQSLVSMDAVYQALSHGIECKHTLLILDCCFAGKFRFSDLHRGRPRPFLLPIHQGRFERFKSSNAWQVLTSAGPEQTAADSAVWANIRNQSPFAQTLIDALEGRADVATSRNRGKNLGDGIVTATELFLYVWDKVEKITSVVKPQHPGLFPMDQHREGEFIFINPRVDPSMLDQLPPDPDINPYKGLKPFNREDHQLFFGREEAIQAILDRLEQVEILFVTGSSGAGKSSLVRAGVFPRLDGIDAFVIVRPNELLTSADGPSVDAEAITPFAAHLTQLQDEETHCILLFDQYEELFSLPDQPLMLARVQQLMDAAHTGKQKVVFTLRSDFEWQVKASSLGGYWTRERIYRVPAMDLDQLREAITGPAWWALYDFKDEANGNDLDTGEVLINEILGDIVNAPGALPLLSFTMHSFFERTKALEGSGRLLTKEVYDELQGVEGAISRIADEEYGTTEQQYIWELSKRQYVFRQLLIRMINLYDGAFVRRRVYYLENEGAVAPHRRLVSNELAFQAQDELVDQIIDDLEQANLVVSDTDEFGAPFVEPAHDALINHWDRCRQWLDEFGNETLLLQRRLWQAVLDTENPDQLPTLGILREEDLATSISNYWELSPRLDEVTKKILDPHDRWIDRFQNNTGILEKLAPLLWDEPMSDDQLALLESLDRPQVQDHPLAKQVLGLTEKESDFLIKVPALDEEITLDSVSLEQAIYLQMDNWLNDQEKEFIKQSWQRRVGRIQQLTAERNEARANELATKATTSTNRKTAFRMAELAQAIDPGNLKVKEQLIRYHALAEEPPHYSLDEHTANVADLIFSPDGSRLLSCGADYMIRFWDTATSASLGKIETPSHRHASSICFWPDHQDRLIVASHDGNVRIWTQENGAWEIRRSLQHPDGEIQVEAVAISPDQRYIASGDDKGEIFLWSAQAAFDGEENVRLDRVNLPGGGEHWTKITAMAFAPQQARLVAGNRFGDVQVWRIENDKLVEEAIFDGHGEQQHIYSAIFLTNDTLLTGAWDRTLWWWRLGEGGVVERKIVAEMSERVDFFIRCAAVSPDHRLLALAVDRQVYVYEFNPDGTRGKLRYELAHDGWPFNKVAFSSNGLLAATAGHSVKVWNLNYQQQVKLEAPYDDVFARGDLFFTGGRHHNLIYSADGNFYLEATPDESQFRLVNKGTGETTTYDHGGLIWYLNFYPGSNSQFISTGKDGWIRLWEAGSTQPVQELETTIDRQQHAGVKEGIGAAVVNRDANLIVSVLSEVGFIELWRKEGDRFSVEPEVVDTTGKLWEGLNGVEFSPDEQSIVVAARQGLKIYDFAEDGTLDPIARVVLSQGQNYAHFTPDGKQIITYKFDGMVEVWDAQTGRQQMAFPEMEKTTWGRLVEDGQKWLIIARYEGNPRAVWFDSGQLVAAANADPWMGALTAEEMTTYQLEPYLTMAGYIDAEGSPAPVIRQGNEAVIYQLARYFDEKCRQSERRVTKMDYFNKAIALYDAGGEIGRLHQTETYGECRRWLQEHMRE